MADYLVYGGGFRGMIAAYILREKGQDVTLIEAQPGLGGVLRSREWNGFALDLGCHLFSNHSERAFSIMYELAGGQVQPVSVRYASITADRHTNEVAVPDFSTTNEDLVKLLIRECKHAAANVNVADIENLDISLEGYMHRRFGMTLGDELSRIAGKLFQRRADELHWHSITSSPLGRVRIADDNISSELKKISGLDDILAVSSIGKELQFLDNHARNFPHKNFYPAFGGLLGFCHTAEQCLSKMGVNLVLGHVIKGLQIEKGEVKISLADSSLHKAKHLIWCLDPQPLAKQLNWDAEVADIHFPVPMVLFYYLVPAHAQIKYTYLHDFSSDKMIYRVSAPGVYGRQINDGLTYLCCECPTTIGSDLWNDPGAYIDRIWSEVLDTKIIDMPTPIATHFMKTPVSYKGLKPEYLLQIQRLEELIYREDNMLTISGLRVFSKNDIVTETEKLISKLL